MGTSVKQLLNGGGENYIFPFFWQHGEDETTLRNYMKIIDEANCHAVCVESRPHPDFCGPKWWQDMDVILDEAKKRGMKVWILDDSHFPTGFANGAALKAPVELRRQSVYCRIFPVNGKKKFSCNLEKVMKKLPSTFMGSVMDKLQKNGEYQFDDDRLLAVSAKVKGNGTPQEIAYTQSAKKLTAVLPEGTEKVYVTFLTRNAGIHRSYINMLDKESCRLLIDAVYEPHWEHYREAFGGTIAGFFSDEPEIGNGVYFNTEITVGKDFDLPWSRELEGELPQRLGDNWKNLLPVLWDNDADADLKAEIRYQYMDLVTRLVEECFSKQMGAWCEEHGVEYIGHLIEDNNQHARLGASLGHYFRGLSGQHMAGIDDIGGQVLPQGEDKEAEGIFKLIGGRDGEFYHYLLGKLGASYAAIDPMKQGRCMCEIFGNYGWSEGPRLEKFLADHFMVQGINRYVPHAFSPKDYPDKDCPPHFYAGGNNPQYRHFGQVIAYMNRVCALISDGKPAVDTAILYHAEAEWMGENMLSQKPARILMENQVDFHILPCDVFAERERYLTDMDADGLKVNGNCYRTLLVPYAQFLPEIFINSLAELKAGGCEVVFIDGLPEGVSEGTVCSLQNILSVVNREVGISPASARIRSFHYRGDEEIYYFVNEDDKPYRGSVTIPKLQNCYVYDAWENRVYQAEYGKDGKLCLDLYPGESRILVAGTVEKAERMIGAVLRDAETNKTDAVRCKTLAEDWTRSVCRAIDYPKFKEAKKVTAFGDYGKEDPKFSGFIRYERDIEISDLRKRYVLEITDAGEDIEVFVNGQSAGIQVLPPFRYDILALLVQGRNRIVIEAATTLEREQKANKKNWAPTGITGEVNLYEIH